MSNIGLVSELSLRIDLELIETQMKILYCTTIHISLEIWDFFEIVIQLCNFWVNYTEWIIAIAALIIYADPILESRICKTKDYII